MMNIFELLKFDFSEFLFSIEGACIIAGIIFLIIGIVLILMSKGKKKTETAPVEQTPAPTQEAVQPVQQATPEAPVMQTAPVENNPIPVVPSVVPNETTNVVPTPVVVPSAETGLQESATTPAVEPINFSQPETIVTPEVTPTVAPVAPVAETLDMATEIKPETIATPEATLAVAPVAESLTTPEVIAPVAPFTPVVPEVVAPVAEALTETPAQVSVYGGANPEVKEIIEEKPREIYGGANPLENTAPIPADTVREAYQGALNSTPVVQPAPAPVTPEVIAPVAPVVPATPEVIAPVVPVVPATPEVVAPVTPVAPVAPEVVVPTAPVTPEVIAPVAPVTPAAPEVVAPVAPTPVAPAAPTEEIEKLEF